MEKHWYEIINIDYEYQAWGVDFEYTFKESGEKGTARLEIPPYFDSYDSINNETYAPDNLEHAYVWGQLRKYYYSQHETRDLAKASAALGLEIDELVNVSDDQGDEYYVAFYDDGDEQYLLEGAGIIGYYGDYEFFTHDPIEDSALEKEMIEQARKKRVTECRV